MKIFIIITLYLAFVCQTVEASSIKLVSIVDIPVKKIHSLSVSSEEKTVFFGESFRLFSIYDLSLNTKKSISVSDDEIISNVFIPKNKIIMLGSKDNFLYIIDARSYRLISKQDMNGQVLQLTKLSNDIVFSSVRDNDKGFKIIDGETGKEERIIADHDGEDHMYGALNGTEDKLLSFGDINKLALWDLKTGKKIWTISIPKGFVSAAAISPDKNIIAHGNQDGDISIRDLSNGALLHTLKGHINIIKGLKFIEKGNKLVSIEDKLIKYDNSGCSLKIWDLISKVPVYVAENFCASSLDISSNEKLLAVSGNELKVFSIQK